VLDLADDHELVAGPDVGTDADDQIRVPLESFVPGDLQ
jgi:hypothetical protein